MNILVDDPKLAIIVPAFRLVAHLEALSWAGLLVGMLFKYLLMDQVELGETLVAIFGSVHGGLVIVYVALAAVTSLRQRWSWGIVALAIVATIPPFATVAFDRWADGRGLYARRAAGERRVS
ncbi:MAG: DUF3817 domain-containing protein [Trueperaceae bacterium]